MQVSEQELTAIVEQNDSQACIGFFQGMPESQRRSLKPLCLNLLKQVGKGRETVNAAEAAVLATGTLSDLRVITWRLTHEQDLVFALLMDRRPDWTAQWAEKLLKDTYFWVHWALLRRLIRAGLMPKPQSPNYILAMISGLVLRGREGETSIEAQLLADPELLSDEVWRLFEVEGGGESSLANYDRFSLGQTWHDALLNLATARRLPRKRLLSCALDALERDFNHYRARWFATFHDALGPTPDELREQAPRYLRLVRASASNIVSWASEIVAKLAEQGVYDPPTLITGLQPALYSRQSSLARRALALLDASAQSSPGAARRAVCAAITALGHETTDVQKAALDLIDKHASAVDAELSLTIAGYAKVVAASLQSRISRWTPDVKEKTSSQKKSAGAKPTDEIDMPKLPAELNRILGIEALLANIKAGRAEIPATTFDGTEIPRLKSVQLLTPIADLDELIDVCARVVEDDSHVDDAERTFDGLSRLCGHKPSDFARRVGPLAKRALQRLKRNAFAFLGNGPGDDLCGLVYAWTTGEIIEWKRNPDRRDQRAIALVAGEQQAWFKENMRKGLGFLSRRSIALAKRVAARRPAALLSAPTHAGGWIAPQALVERANSWSGDEPDQTDTCLAMLRLAPDGRAEALKTLREMKAEWGRAIRYALGAPRVTLGDTAALWVAAARARAPWADDERIEKAFPDYGPDAGRKADYLVSFRNVRYEKKLKIHSEPPSPKSIDPDCVTVTLHAQRGVGENFDFELGGPGGRTVGSVRWTATIWPQARESLFAAALDTIAWNIDWWQAAWQNKTLLEPLLDCGTPLRTMGLMLLATALAAKEPGEYGLASDIAIRAIEEGRLGSDNLGTVLEQLLPTGLIKPARWQKTLADVARASPVHALVVQRALQSSLHGEPDKLPRDFAKLLDLLYELSIELNLHISHEGCRRFLQQLASGKAGKLAKNLLNLPATEFSSTARPILATAIQQRAAAGAPLIG
jgi:hypothetical protein